MFNHAPTVNARRRYICAVVTEIIFEILDSIFALKPRYLGCFSQRERLFFLLRGAEAATIWWNWRGSV